VTCDGCGGRLDAVPDVAEMRDEYARRKRDMALAVASIVGMIVLNGLVFGGGAFVILTAPIGWFLWSLFRFRALKGALARQDARHRGLPREP
jgi:hypothetical protein